MFQAISEQNSFLSCCGAGYQNWEQRNYLHTQNTSWYLDILEKEEVTSLTQKNEMPKIILGKREQKSDRIFWGNTEVFVVIKEQSPILP